ncbi:ferrochelatase [Candidatus Palauibacter irciniicola]|uniref:ferrochelatase n=1 Tax=Candidatus Palauibacter irciniicola TaxID=3056733 RepID=UPI003B023B4C
MANSEPRPAVLLLNFGEPTGADPSAVARFLERIFLANARLEPHMDAAAARARSRELARRRTPGLLEVYDRIGGSPLHAQAEAQTEALHRALRARGHPMRVTMGMQFTEPSIEEALRRLRETGAEALVPLPVYPLCGPSTTVAALDEVEDALERIGWCPEVRGVTGWHRHPRYARLRADAIRRAAAEAGWSLTDRDVHLVFSAHGTPLRYVEAGSRYVDYVEEWCATQARALGVETWTLGYQNHTNRRIEWTPPDIETALERLRGVAKILVDPVSFMHEQSETLMELDVDLAGHAAALGLEFRRVGIPHDDGAFAEVLADLALTALGVEVPALPPGTSCRCRPGTDVCFNGEPST